MEGLIDQFHSIVKDFRLKRHDLLAYHNNKFDRDYVEFNVKISDLECSLQARLIAVHPFVCGLFAGCCPEPGHLLAPPPLPYLPDAFSDFTSTQRINGGGGRFLSQVLFGRFSSARD